MTSYLDRINRFWQLNDDRPFTAAETRLYFALLREFNSQGWPAAITIAAAALAALAGVSAKTMTKARKALADRGLIAATASSRTAPLAYSLLDGAAAAPEAKAAEKQAAGAAKPKAEEAAAKQPEAAAGQEGRGLSHSTSPLRGEERAATMPAGSACGREGSSQAVALSKRAIAPEDLRQFLAEFFAPCHANLIRDCCARMKITDARFRDLAAEVITDWQLARTVHRDYRDAATHLLTLIRIKHNETSRRNHNQKLPDAPGYGLIRR